jgi:hypothetical protein
MKTDTRKLKFCEDCEGIISGTTTGKVEMCTCTQFDKDFFAWYKKASQNFYIYNLSDKQTSKASFLAGMKYASQKPVAMTEEQIGILARWISDKKCHTIDDPKLKLLNKLDNIWDGVYQANRIKLDFKHAAILANESVIKQFKI